MTERAYLVHRDGTIHNQPSATHTGISYRVDNNGALTISGLEKKTERVGFFWKRDQVYSRQYAVVTYAPGTWYRIEAK